MARTSTQAGGGGIPTHVNPNVWFTFFGGRKLIFCFLEMIKNGFDWGASTIEFITNESRDQIRYVDNGVGMNERNRASFLSVGDTTAGREDQSGIFGTGGKYMIFTYSKWVLVVTAPQDDPNNVHIFRFTPEELAASYQGDGTIPHEVVAKTAKSWPYENPFGTVITYTLRDKNSRSIYRDEALARILSDRLDNIMVENGMVRVNGQSLPKKLINGSVYRFELPAKANPALGRVRFEFYWPAKKAREEDLLMTGRALGEVPFRGSFLQSISTQQFELVPELFRSGQVCGLISASFLNDHVMESRDKYAATIADDERVNELLRLMAAIEKDVAARLGIKLRHIDNEDTLGIEEISEVIERFQKVYNPDGDVPPRYREQVCDDEGPSREPRRRRAGGKPVTSGLPRLEINGDEFEVGETIEIQLVTEEGQSGRYTWYTKQSKAKVDDQGDSYIRLRASDIGRGLVSAVRPGTGQSAKIEYEVVSERRFNISASKLSVETGSRTRVTANNTDRLKGKLKWVLSGEGELEVAINGRSATFIAGSRYTEVQITAYDSANSNTTSTCVIVVVPESKKGSVFRIRDHYFSLEVTENNLPEFGKLATIILADRDEVHKLVINSNAPGYQLALKAGILQEALMASIAVEFAKTIYFAENEDDLRPNEMADVVQYIQNDAANIYEEILSGVS